jgi:hypothetical protein
MSNIRPINLDDLFDYGGFEMDAQVNDEFAAPGTIKQTQEFLAIFMPPEVQQALLTLMKWVNERDCEEEYRSFAAPLLNEEPPILLSR